MNTVQKLQVPAGDVLIRKIKGSEGIHERIGYCKTGRIYTVGDQWGKRMVEGGEFEYVYHPAVNVEIAAANEVGPVIAQVATDIKAVADAMPVPASETGGKPLKKSGGK